MTDLPKKLKVDSITEAVFEIRFEREDPPEIALGKLLGAWSEFKASRLPLNDVPAQLREQDLNLKFQPVYQLASPDGLHSIAVGPNVVVLSVTSPYPGWDDAFSGMIKTSVDNLYNFCNPVNVSRLGLRYLNAMNEEDHKIRSPFDLNLELKINGEIPSPEININFLKSFGTNTEVLVRIATPSFIKTLPKGANTYIDVDVRTLGELETMDAKQVLVWAEDAHQIEKTEYFSLIPSEIIEKLKAE